MNSNTIKMKINSSGSKETPILDFFATYRIGLSIMTVV